MKILTIAGTVNSSELVEVKGQGVQLKVSVALNHVSPCEWIDVFSSNTALSIEKGSRVSASGNSEEKAYIKKDGKAGLSRKLYATSFEVLYSPGKPEELTTESSEAYHAPSNEPQTTGNAKPPVEAQATVEEKNPLEIAIETIDAAKTLKQCNFLYHNVVKTLVDEEDRAIAQSALNSRKKALGYSNVKKAA